MLSVSIDLDDRLVRRLSSIVRDADTLIIMHTGRTLHVINDKGEFFKSISINSISDNEIFISCESIQFKLLSMPGTLVLTLKENVMELSFHITNGKDKLCAWKTESVVSPFTKFHLQSYLNILENKSSNLFKIEALNNVKEMIASCTATTSGLEITNGRAVTKSNNLIIYQDVIDKDLKVSFSNVGLREMDKFKLDCESSSIGNYIVMYRDDYTLAVRKGVSGSTSEIPTQYMKDHMADFRIALNLHVLMPMLNELNYKELGGVCECSIDLKNQITKIEIGNMTCRIAIPVYEVKKITQLDMKLETIKFNLLELKPASRMLKQSKRHEIYLYKGVARMELKNSNLIVRYEVG